MSSKKVNSQLQKKADVEIIVKENNNNSKSQNSNRNSRSKQVNPRKNDHQVHPSGASMSSNETRGFIDGCLYPDVSGPIRIPRSGSASRTGLGILCTTYLCGSTTLWTAVRGYPNLQENACVSTSTSASATFGADTIIPGGMQFPASTQISDWNLVGTSFVISYTGAPLNATGEIIIGTVPNLTFSSVASFNGMTYYPGVIRIPISDLINRPIRVSGRKLSPDSDLFTTSTGAIPDVETPFVMITPLASANSITIKMTTTFEYRSTISASNIVPYESTTNSFSKDLMAYQDAAATISQLPSLVSNGLGDYLVGKAKQILGKGAKYLFDMGMNAITSGLMTRHLSNVRGNSPLLMQSELLKDPSSKDDENVNTPTLHKKKGLGFGFT